MTEQERRRERRAWYWFDWANSAYVTTIQTVLLGPYLTSVAKQAACPGIDNDATCHTDLHVLGIPVSPGSLVFYVVTISTIFSALVLPIVLRFHPTVNSCLGPQFTCALMDVATDGVWSCAAP